MLLKYCYVPLNALKIFLFSGHHMSSMSTATLIFFSLFSYDPLRNLEILCHSSLRTLKLLFYIYFRRQRTKDACSKFVLEEKGEDEDEDEKEQDEEEEEEEENRRGRKTEGRRHEGG